MRRLAYMLSGLIMIGMGISNTSNAATKCVALNASATCSGTPTPGKVDWTATCNSIPITGVGVCSSTYGSGDQTTDSIVPGESVSENIYCWCKLISPAVSKWVFAGNAGNATTCAKGCVHNCVLGLVNTDTTFVKYRAALFNNLQ